MGNIVFGAEKHVKQCNPVFYGDIHGKEEEKQGELLKLRQSSPWGRIPLYHFLAVKSWRWQEGLNLQSFAVVRTDLNDLLQGKHVKNVSI